MINHLLAILWVGVRTTEAFSEFTCLPPPVEGPLERKKLDLPDGTQGDLVMSVGNWDSARVSAEITGIIFTEVLGISVSMATVGGSAGAIESIVGCKYGALDDKDEDGVLDDPDCEQIHDVPPGMMDMENWFTERGAFVSKKHPTLISNGLIGYDGQEGLYFFSTMREAAWEKDQTALEYYRSYLVKRPDVFAKPSNITIGDLEGCRGGNDELLRTNGYKCSDDGYWYPDRCKDDRDSCVPTLMGGVGWMGLETVQLIAYNNLPIAISFLAYGDTVGRINNGTKALFFWWQPDWSFQGLKFTGYGGATRMIFPKHNRLEWKAGVYNTDYPDFVLGKHAWSRLSTIHPTAYDVWKMVRIEQDEMDKAMDDLYNNQTNPEYIDAEGKIDMNKMRFATACSWIKTHKAVWEKWIPDRLQCKLGSGLIDVDGSYVSDKSAASQCSRCGPGYFSVPVFDENTGLTQHLCQVCKPGEYANAFGMAACGYCEPGLWSKSGQGSCDRCAQGTYSEVSGTSECTECPSSFITLFQGATSKLDCLCPEGTYYSEAGTCTPCLERSGLACTGDKNKPGDTPPMLEPGFMALPYSQDAPKAQDSTANKTSQVLPPVRLSTYRCTSDALCPGGRSPLMWEDVCFGGRTGIACSVCPENQYIKGNGVCGVCEDDAAQNTYLAILALPLLCAYLYRKLNDGNGESEMKADDEAFAQEEAAKKAAAGEKKPHATHLKKSVLQNILIMLLLFYEQVFTVVKDCFSLLLEFIQSAQVVTSLTDLPTQKSVMKFGALDLQGLGVLLMFDINKLLDILGIRLQCVTGPSFANRFAVELCIPLVIVFFFLFDFAVCKIFLHPFQKSLRQKVRGKKGPVNKILKFIAYADMNWDKVVNALGSQVTTLFIGLTSLALSIHVTFEHPPDGGPPRYSLRRFPEVLTDSEERKSMMGVSIVAFLLYTIGVLAGSIFVCWRAPFKAHDPGFQTKYFFLLDGFRPERWWWGTALLMKGLLLNLTLAVFASPRIQNVGLAVIFMVSLAMLFTFSPWPKSIQNAIDTVSHIACAMLLATTSYFILAAEDDGKGTILGLAVASMGAPLVVALCCMVVPMYQFAVRRSHSIKSYRLGQRLRDLLLLVTRRSNNEMNIFLRSLDDSDMMSISKAMDVFYTRMFHLHPSRHFAGNRIITETEEYEIATDKSITEKLERANLEENRDDGESIRERALIQWFVEMLLKGSGLTSGMEKTDGPGTVSLGTLFDELDEHDYGIIEKGEFVQNAIRLNPLITEEEAAKVFDMMDLDAGGSLDREEFDIIMSGMTFTGQSLDSDTKEGKYLREAPPKEELDDQRKTCSRLAVMFETANFTLDVSSSEEQQRRVRAGCSFVDLAKVPKRGSVDQKDEETTPREFTGGERDTVANPKVEDSPEPPKVEDSPEPPKLSSVEQAEIQNFFDPEEQKNLRLYVI